MPSVNPLTLAKLIASVKKYGKTQQIESEAIANIDFDVESGDLTVEFHQRGTYVYHGVDLDMYTDFAQASSWGTYFNLYIRNIGLSYERVG
jgi:FlaG/FlaF family flagellin (archaellin)